MRSFHPALLFASPLRLARPFKLLKRPPTPPPPASVPLNPHPTLPCSFAPTDEKFASCSDDGLVRVFDFWRRTPDVELKGHLWDVRSVAWHPQKALIASGGKDSLVKLWDPAAGKAVNTMSVRGT
jgi:WD40 repeat protein